ncbi:MAG: hypothetical protein ACRDGT_06580 [Candidatus Limnocylindria bacterium]
MGEKDPVKDRAALREDEPEITDDLETAEAKSGSVDERILEPTDADAIKADRPVPASNVPQGGLGVPPAERPSEGERALEHERKAQRAPKQPG